MFQTFTYKKVTKITKQDGTTEETVETSSGPKAQAETEKASEEMDTHFKKMDSFFKKMSEAFKELL